MADPDPEPLPDEAIVVRGGKMSAESFVKGAVEHLEQSAVYGLSVQAGVRCTLEELAEAGNIKNGLLGVATAGQIRRAGYSLVKTPGRGMHWTLVVPRNFGQQAALELARVFRQETNFWVDRRRSR